jgi:hypothetical protein
VPVDAVRTQDERILSLDIDGRDFPEFSVVPEYGLTTVNQDDDLHQ